VLSVLSCSVRLDLLIYCAQAADDDDEEQRQQQPGDDVTKMADDDVTDHAAAGDDDNNNNYDEDGDYDDSRGRRDSLAGDESFCTDRRTFSADDDSFSDVQSQTHEV